jgi:protein associated with RNAse G/E
VGHALNNCGRLNGPPAYAVGTDFIAWLEYTRMPDQAQITVRVLKYDGTEYRRWGATLGRQDASLIVLDAEFEYDVDHNLLGKIGRGTRTIEYYWSNRWYNIFRFLEHDGTTKLYYCNVNMPPDLSCGVLSYVDLDIDILVQPDFSYQVLDLDEFATNAARYGYPEELRQRAHQAVDELISLIDTRQFPFS